MAAQTAESSTGSLVRSDSLLCEKCHTWNDVAFLSSKSQSKDYYGPHAVDIPLDAEYPDCAICGAVYTAAKTRIKWEQSEGRTYANSLIARNLGPVFKDNKFTLKERVDDSRPGESRLLVAIYVKIYELTESPLVPEARTASDSDYEPNADQKIEYRRVHRLAPRFCLRHTKDVPTRLSGVDPWEAPFFDVGLLKSWISACESIHSADPSSQLVDNDTCKFDGRSLSFCRLLAEWTNQMSRWHITG